MIDRALCYLFGIKRLILTSLSHYRWPSTSGFYTDFCTLIAGGIFGDKADVRPVEYPSWSHGLRALTSEDIDVLPGVPVVATSEEATAELSFYFSPPIYYGGWGFGGVPK